MYESQNGTNGLSKYQRKEAGHELSRVGKSCGRRQAFENVIRLYQDGFIKA